MIVCGYSEVLAQTLWDQAEDVDHAAQIGPSRRTNLPALQAIQPTIPSQQSDSIC